MTVPSDEKLELFLNLLKDKVITIDDDYTITHTGSGIKYKIGVRRSMPYVQHTMNGQRYGLSCHTLVWMHKHGECPPSHAHIRAKDGDSLNWHYDNLEVKAGKRIYRMSNTKQRAAASDTFTDDDVKSYRQKYFDKEMTLAQICSMTNCEPRKIRDMLHGNTYKHISVEPYRDRILSIESNKHEHDTKTSELMFLSYHLHRINHISFHVVGKILGISYLDVYRNAVTYPPEQYNAALQLYINKYANKPECLELYKLYRNESNEEDDVRSVAAE